VLLWAKDLDPLGCRRAALRNASKVSSSLSNGISDSVILGAYLFSAHDLPTNGSKFGFHSGQSLGMG